jgi:hypothetical protein
LAVASYGSLRSRLEFLIEEAAGHDRLNAQQQEMPQQNFTDTGNVLTAPPQVFGARDGFAPSGILDTVSSFAGLAYLEPVRRTTSAQEASGPAGGNTPHQAKSEEKSDFGHNTPHPLRVRSASSFFSPTMKRPPPEAIAPPLPKKGGSRKLRKRTTVRRKKIMRKTKKRTYRKKSQKRNNRK